jgi:aerobic C4-dicarboxylate transport protein
MQPLGDAFIKAIRVLIAPIIFCTVVHGIARMADLARVGRVALTVDTSTIKPLVTQTQNQGVVSFLMNIIPSTFIGAFAEGNVLQVLLLAVVCGFALTWLRDAGKPVLDLVDVISRMLFQIVKIVMWTAPLGAFGAIAFTVGKFGTVSLLSLGKLILGFYVTCLIFIAIVLWPIARFCGFSLLKLLRYIREELLICIATTSSETVLPRMLVKLEELGCEGTVVGLVVPTGYSFNLDGTCLYLSCTVVFLAQATNTHLSLTQQIGLLAVLLLTSKGAAGIAGAAFVVLAATLATTGTIPVASVALVLGIHRLLSQGLTPTNLVGNAVATIAMAKWEGALDEKQLHQALDGGPAKVSSTD